MITRGHTDNGGGYAAAEYHFAPRRVRGPHLQPQRSLTRSLTRRPTAAFDPGASTAPNRRTARAGPAPARLARGVNETTQPQDHNNRSLYGFRGLPVIDLRWLWLASGEIVLVGVRDEVTGMLFCRWLLLFVGVGVGGQPVGTGSVASRVNAAARWLAQGQQCWMRSQSRRWPWVSRAATWSSR